jgi:hypothetical protein
MKPTNPEVSCLGKIAYPTRARAHRALRHHTKTRAITYGEMRAYACSCCGKFHIGHPPGSRRRTITKGHP